MEPFPYWRNIYNTVVDEFKAVNVSYVSEVLSEVDKDLLEGLTLYKKYHSDSYTAWKNKIQVTNSGNIDKLLKDTSYAIDLDCTIAYRMFCNYIMFEYYGKITDIEEAALVELYRKLFISKIWQFVSAERMFQLKTMQFLVHHYKEKDHKLYTVINDFITRHTLKKIRQQLLDQFKILMNDICPHGDHGLSNHDCIVRDRSELIQILITYIHTIEHEPLEAEELANLLSLFNDHGFAINIAYTSMESESHNLEYSTLLIALKHNWEKSTPAQNFNQIEKVFNEICSMANCHSILILCWSMMLLSLPVDQIPAKCMSKLPKLILQSLNSESFKQLHNLLDNGYKKETKLNLLIYKAVYSFYKQICSRIDNLMKIYETENSIKVLAKLITIPEICDDIMLDNTNPVRKLFDATINLFPYDTQSFCSLLTTLIKHERYATNVIAHLKSINIYSEVLMDNSNVSIPHRSQTCVIQLSNNKTLVQYQGTNISYSFLASLEVNFQNLLDYLTSSEDENPKLNQEMNNVIASFDLLCELIEKCTEIWNDKHFHQIISFCKLVLARMSVETCKSAKLVDRILKMFTRGMRKRSKMLSSILLSTTCLPTATAHMLPIHQLVKINLLHDCQLLQLIMRERSKGNYELIYTYLEFIKDCLKYQHENERFLLPGLIFIIQHIFPMHLGWKEPTVHEKNKLSYDILTMLFNILHSHAIDKSEDRSLKLINEISVLTILNNDAFVKTFLTILRYRNEYIEQLMIREVDWEIGCTRDVILSVRQTVTIVLWLFKNIAYDELKKTVFWQYFSYSGVNFPSVLRITCEYINHKFDSVLPKLACRLFRRISVDSSIPVLACMEIDNYQVQSMFLERLRDPLEDDEMRIALLELITTCVKTQNGMTAAFFNMHVKKPQESIFPDKGDETIINFLGEYLDSIAQSPETLKCPVQSAILRLFHTLWKEKRLSLIQSLITQNTFWSSLINPLDKNYDFRCETYYQILDILAMESYYKPANELPTHIQELFSNKLNLLKKIYTLILHSLRKYDDDYEGVIKIQIAWKNFIILMIRNHKKSINIDARLFIMRSTLEALLDHLKSPKNISIIANWLELYMYLTTHLEITSYDTEENLKMLCSCYKHLEEIYQRLNKKCREAVITIIIRSVQQFKSFFAKPSDTCDEFLFIVRKIIEKEYDEVIHRQGKTLNCSDHVAWHLILILGNHILKFEHHHKWLFFTQYIHKVSSSLGFYASSVVTMPIAKISAMFLLNAAKSTIMEEFKILDFADIYQSMRSPPELRNYAALQKNGKNPDIYMDYWLMYSYLVNMKSELLEKLGFCMFKKSLDFVHMQRDELFQFFKLMQVTVNPVALKLIASCIRLFNQLLRWDGIMDMSTISAYYEMLPEVLNSCINIILRPKMIKFYVPYEVVNLELLESVPLIYVTNIMNHILDIITISCRGLLQVSPSLDKLVQRIITRTSHQLQLSWDFHIPNVYNPNENIKSLTFGALMCVVHYLSKAHQLQVSNKHTVKKDAMIYIPTMLQETEPDSRPEEEVKMYVSFLCPDYIEPAAIEPFNSIHRFATSEIYSLTSPWLCLMDQERTSIALEIINTLLASQIYKTVTMPISDWDVKQQMHMLKRELCSELHFFHDFVRKHHTHSQKYEIDGNRIVCKHKAIDKSYTSYDYLMMLSHWFMEICCLTP